MKTPFAERGLPRGLTTHEPSFSAAARTVFCVGGFFTQEMNGRGLYAVEPLSEPVVVTELDVAGLLPIEVSDETLAHGKGGIAGPSFLGH